MIYLALLLALASYGFGFRYGKSVGRKEQSTLVHCYAYKGILDDWIKKDHIIHRRETRIFRLKRANRNLRENLRVKANKQVADAQEEKGQS